MHQPSRRSGIGPGGVHTVRTNGIRVARRAAAIAVLSTPAKVTPAPRTNIDVTASHGMGEISVPSTISPAPADARPA